MQKQNNPQQAKALALWAHYKTGHIYTMRKDAFLKAIEDFYNYVKLEKANEKDNVRG
jgi:hypothetical protein